VREIAAAADPVTRTFQVKAGIGGADAKLGQTATVLIDTRQAAGVIRLPLTAMLESNGRTAVWVLDPAAMTVRVKPVQVAGADGNEVVIASGLAPGEEVVTAGVHVLTAGQKVRRYVEPASPAAASGAARPVRPAAGPAPEAATPAADASR